MEEKDFKQKIYDLVNSIPEGRVLTYGIAAAMCGKPGNARHVGRILKESQEDINAFRVVHSDGATCPGWDGQRVLLIEDNVSFKPNGRVDIKKHLWKLN